MEKADRRRNIVDQRRSSLPDAESDRGEEREGADG